MSRLFLALLLALGACGDNLQPVEPDAGSGPDAMTVEGPDPLPPRCFPGWHLSADRKSCVRNADAGS